MQLTVSGVAMQSFGSGEGTQSITNYSYGEQWDLPHLVEALHTVSGILTYLLSVKWPATLREARSH